MVQNHVTKLINCLNDDKHIFGDKNFLKRERYHLSPDRSFYIEDGYHPKESLEMLTDFGNFFQRYKKESVSINTEFDLYSPSENFLDFILCSALYLKHNTRILNARTTDELINLDTALEYPISGENKRKLIPYGHNPKNILLLDKEDMKNIFRNKTIQETSDEIKQYLLCRNELSTYDPNNDLMILSRDVVNEEWTSWKIIESLHMGTQLKKAYKNQEPKEMILSSDRFVPKPLTPFTEPGPYKVGIIEPRKDVSVLGTLILHENIMRILSLDTFDYQPFFRSKEFLDDHPDLKNGMKDLTGRLSHIMPKERMAKEMAYMAEYPENWDKLDSFVQDNLNVLI